MGVACARVARANQDRERYWDDGCQLVPAHPPTSSSHLLSLAQGEADSTWVFMGWEGVEAARKGLELNAFK